VGAGRRAVCGFGEGEAVRVVHEPHWAAESLLEIAAQRLAVEPGRVGVLHESCAGDDRSRNAHTDGGVVGVGFELPHQSRDGVERRHIVGRRRGAVSGDLLTSGRQGDSFDLRSAEVDADTHVHDGTYLRRATPALLSGAGLRQS
jgi:hypothetical protein